LDARCRAKVAARCGRRKRPIEASTAHVLERNVTRRGHDDESESEAEGGDRGGDESDVVGQ